MNTQRVPSKIDRMARQCVAVRTRMLNRVVSRIYDDLLRPHGVRVSQLNVLVAVGAFGTATPRQVQEALAMEQSTVSRTLDRLAGSGWIESIEEDDGRVRPVRLSAEGEELLERVAPAWERAQERIRELVGAGGVESLHGLAEQVREEVR